MKERFIPTDINPRLFHGDIGDSFQRFIRDLLNHEYEARGRLLTCFAGRGKDGGIDLVADAPGQLEVLECKVCGAGSPNQVRAAWLKTAERLRRNLMDPAGPTSGQSQYEPWYRTSLPIRKYVLCTTYEALNEAHRGKLTELREEIQEFFVQMGREHKHLLHLKEVRVEDVIDWAAIERKLVAQKHVLLRWFPASRVIGLAPIEEVTDSQDSYRAYLNAGRLPFYGQGTHAQKVLPPPDLALAIAPELLRTIVPGVRDGVIVSGPGGVGKTRLTLEIAHAALQAGWSVLRAGPRLKPERIDELAELLGPSDRVLVVLDYVETTDDFIGLLEEIRNVNDSRGLQIGYVASSRSSFYRSTLAIDSRHHHVDLSLLADPRTSEWLRGYLGAAVCHVLGQGFGEADPAHLGMCGNVPALAVFLVYLHASGRNEDLDELVHDRDFARWVIRRLTMTFPGSDVSASVAMLAAMLPMSADAVARLNPEHHGILDRLVEDGWVELLRVGDERRFEAIHDVLADEIVLHHLASAHASREKFLDLLFSEAVRLGSLESLLVGLERIVEAPVLRDTDLCSHIGRCMRSSPVSWPEATATVLRMSALTTADKISLHRSYPEAWDGSGGSTDVQNSLGWIARSVVRGGPAELEEESLLNLVSWIEETVPEIARSNYLLTWGLRLAPERFREAALSWLMAKPRLFQSHYICVAWLECSLPAGLIEPLVAQWASVHARKPHFSFLVRAWLDDGGSPAVLRDGIEVWLAEHGDKEAAQFVYRAWLDATKDRGLVEAGMRGWLVGHRNREDAQYVYRAWLDATKDRGLVEAGIRGWLVENGNKEVAGFVYRSWLDATKDRELVEGCIRGWLAEHGSKEAAQFVYRAWLDATKDRGLVESSIRGWLGEHGNKESAQFVYRAWLDATRDWTCVVADVTSWLILWASHDEVDYLVRAWAEAEGPFEVVREAAFHWLHLHAEEERAVYLTKPIAQRSHLPTEVTTDVLRWCTAHHSNEDAIWRLSQLGRNLQASGLAGSSVHVARLVIA